MSEYPLVDIHTHSELIPKDVVAIRNVFYGDALNYRFDIKRFYSIGLHPWFIEGADDTFDPAKLEMLAAKPFVMAIGEIGLDSTADIDIEKQSRIFELQLTVAHKLKKPVIIHCVRTISYFIPKFKNNSFKVPVILHGYNCNAEITGSLINKNCFFSFGKALLKEESKASKVFNLIPEQNLFLETDESTISIEKIYEAGARIRNISTSRLKDIIADNFRRCFILGNK